MDVRTYLISRALNKGGGGGDITVEPLTVNENGQYAAPSGKAYSPVGVSVQPTLQSKTVTENGTVTPDSGYDGLSSVLVDVQGGGGVTVLQGLSVPTVDVGENGDLFFQVSQAGVKNTAGQYINTGYSGNSNSKYIVEFTVVENQSSQYPTVFGARSAPGSIFNASAFCLGATIYNYDYSSAQWGSQETGIQFDNFPGYNYIKGKLVQFEISAGTAKMKVDSDEYTRLFTPTDISSTTPIGIFGYLVGGNLQSFSPINGMVLYRFRIYENDVLVHDFIPAHDTNNVVCVYDNVDQQYIYHSGSGTLQYVEEDSIQSTFLKVNGTWQPLIGSDIGDVG